MIMAELKDPGGVLGKIAAHTGERLARFKTDFPAEKLAAMPFFNRTPGKFCSAFDGAGPRVIAEVKFASPSEGPLRSHPKPSADEAVRVAGSYLRAGACALSVLTEPDHFSGSPKFLFAVRSAYPDAFLLMKDFFIDPYQFELARANGADAVLLIAALLGEKLKPMLDQSRERGLTALVEVHDEAELESAQKAGAELIGINSRDLKTLKTDLAVAERLAPLAEGGLLIAESGIQTRSDIDKLTSCGFKGFLIGTSLMRSADPGYALKEILK